MLSKRPKKTHKNKQKNKKTYVFQYKPKTKLNSTRASSAFHLNISNVLATLAGTSKCYNIYIYMQTNSAFYLSK